MPAVVGAAATFSALVAICATKALLAVSVFTVGSTALASDAVAKEPPRRSRAYPVPRSRVAISLQEKLFENGCYGNQLTRDVELDGGRFFLKSRKALWVFIDTVNSNLAGSAKFTGAQLTPEAINAAFSIGRIANTPQYCKTYGAEFLNLYYTDKNEHLDGRLSNAGTCRKDTIGREYLQSLKGVQGASTVSDSMRAVIAKFDATVFPPGKGDSVVLSDDSAQTIKDYGIPGVSSDSTLRALKRASRHFDNLVLSYALQSPGCAQCSKINDWRYLRSIASANAGFLIGKDPTNDIFKRFAVDDIPEDLMDEARENIRVYRSITARLNRELRANKSPALIRTLIEQRDSEMFGVIEYFANTQSTAKTMSEIAQSHCIGFDGTAIYQ